MKNLTELREQLRDMQDELKRLTNAAMMAADDKTATADDLDKHRNAVKAQKARIDVVREAISDMEGTQQKKQEPAEKPTEKQAKAPEKEPNENQGDAPAGTEDVQKKKPRRRPNYRHRRPKHTGENTAE